MPKTPEGKKMLTVYIDETLYKKFWYFLHEKYNKQVYGALSLEVEAAIESYLDNCGLRTQTHKLQNPVTPRIRRGLQKIIQHLTSSAPGCERFKASQVENSIIETTGYDPRTIRDWKIRLERFGYLKRDAVNPNIFCLSVAFKEFRDFEKRYTASTGGQVDEQK